MAVCTKCGVQVADGLEVCPVCGAPVQMTNQQNAPGQGYQQMPGGYGMQGQQQMSGNQQMSGGYGTQMPGGYGAQMPPKKSHAGLIVGIIAAVAVIALVVVLLFVFVINKGDDKEDGNKETPPSTTGAADITDTPKPTDTPTTTEPTVEPTDIPVAEQGKSSYQEAARIYAQGYEDKDLDITVSVYPSVMREAIKAELLDPCTNEAEWWNLMTMYYGEDMYITTKLSGTASLDKSDLRDLEGILSGSYAYDCHISEGILQGLEMTVHASGGNDTVYLVLYCVEIDGSWYVIGAEDNTPSDAGGEYEEEYLRVADGYVSSLAEMDIDTAVTYCYPAIRDDVRDAFGGMTQQQAWDNLRSTYGDDVTVSYELGSITRIESSDLADYEMVLSFYYDCDCTVTDGYIIEFTMEYAGSEGQEQTSGELYMLEIDGEWYTLG